MPILELIQATRAYGKGTIKTLFPDSLIPMEYYLGEKSGTLSLHSLRILHFVRL